MTVDKVADSFLDTSAFSKGALWLNGQPLGRIWSIGPEQTLYVPGPRLHAGENQIGVFELDAHSGTYALTGHDEPILDRLSPK